MLRKAATHARKRPRGQKARWFGHPLVLFAIIAALAVDFWSIPSGPSFGPSVIKQAAVRGIDNILGRARPTGPHWRFPGHFVQRGDEIRVIWFYTSSAPGQYTDADLGTLLAQGWHYPGRMFYRLRKGKGLYHITSRTTHFSFPSQATPAEEREMARALIDGYESLTPNHELRQWEALNEAHRMLSNGVRSETAHLPLGYLRNTLAFTLLVLLITLPILGRTDRWLKSWLARIFRRRQPWQCQACGYDVRGLNQCPECGTTVEWNG